MLIIAVVIPFDNNSLEIMSWILQMVKFHEGDANGKRVKQKLIKHVNM